MVKGLDLPCPLFEGRVFLLIFYAMDVCFLRLPWVDIILIIGRDNKTPTRRRTEVFELGNAQARSVWVVSNQMEAVMHKNLATIAGTLAILSGALVVSDRAEAGASASAPSKYARAQHAASNQTVRQAGRNDVGITEYSSSSVRNRSQPR
jgi:hypothetical protein